LIVRYGLIFGLFMQQLLLALMVLSCLNRRFVIKGEI